MRILIVLAVALIVTALAPPARAQDAAELRRELEQMRRNFEALQKEHQKSMEALAERLRRLESQPPAPAPVATQTPPSTMDLLRPRQPFTLSQQRGTGQLLFDIGIAGDFVGNLTQRNVDKAGAGTFRGRENRFFPREVELSLFGQIDPYARGEVRIEMGEEARGQETAVSLAEAHLTLLTLPFNTQLKMGQMRTRYGWSNQLHEHDLPWIDRPAVYRYFFGEEGLIEKGFEATWVPGLPFYLEVLGGVFNGDNETAFGRGRIREPLVTGRLRTFFELTDEHALQVGLSVASGRTAERQRNTLPGFDVRYKFRPEGWLHPLLTVGGEGIWSIRRREVTRDIDIPDDTFTRFGWYAYAEVQPFRRWAGGLRYDYTELLDRGRERAFEPYVTFWPSEFLRFRLAYRLTERTQDAGFSANSASARHVDELLFQATFILGAHPAHQF
ncbi:MAG: hypothetical protein FJZ38_14650 [Candidatus Rokubacteria bacterium]|nr:hypothetical protein [Candidatus Rokubacteria bacterium]